MTRSVHADGVGNDAPARPRHNRVLVAVARKLVLVLHAMWRDGSEFRFGQVPRTPWRRRVERARLWHREVNPA
jgi:hypothetical protein